MSALHQVVEQVHTLLGQLPGTTVLRTETGSSSVRIELLVGDLSAISALQQLALGANVLLGPSLAQPQLGAGFAPTKFTLVANTSAIDPIQSGSLQLLGIHLIWHLHKVGVLTTSHANLLLHNWQGAAVGI